MNKSSGLKATFLIATLKPAAELSHTEILSRLLGDALSPLGVESEWIHLADRNIELGTKNDMGKDDEWPAILEKLFASDIVIFGTPTWWGSHSSLMQKVLERMDNVRGDEFTKTGKSPFNNKVGAIIVTGAQDGAEQIIGHLMMVMSWVGFTIAPAGSLSIIAASNYSSDNEKEIRTSYQKEYGAMAKVTAQNIANLAALLKKRSASE